ncbi:MAG TPA: formate dehydrogenase accessory sulfurtransferase FdhD [Halothiobacillus sp.]|nr:MAG: sulfurtransferase FdhD [Halothiobacillus sp. 20-54-6]HQT42483.1 formate dehydrogenase accessory sulfurtransferase FdhD [Halothiobacillus sp.]
MNSNQPAIECVSTQSISRWRDQYWTNEQDQLAIEVPVALQFNGVSHAVMLATPCNLEHFALGFALSEGIVGSRAEFHTAHITHSALGITIACDIASPAFMKLSERRRNMTGRTGCGLCGVESLEQVFRPLPGSAPAAQPISAPSMRIALKNLSRLQPLNRLTGGMHAAAWSASDGTLQQVCEDVGRHNALDKLIGMMAERNVNFEEGFLLITSRASVEMVQKAATVGMRSLIAISAPTALAVKTAQAAGMTLIAFARGDAFVAYTHADRINVTD